MIRKLNKKIQDFLKPKRLAMGKYIFDRKVEKVKCHLGEIIQKNNVESIVFLRYDGKIGDMVVTSFMFREIKRVFPHVKISVVAQGAAKSIINENPYIDKIYNYSKGLLDMLKLAKEIKSEKYDLLVSFDEVLRVRPMIFINSCRAKINIGLDKDNWNLFDATFHHPKKKTRHIQDTYIELLKLLGVKTIDKKYDLYISSMDEKKVDEFIEQELKNSEYIVLNPYAASKHRSFNRNKIEEMIETICVVEKEKNNSIEKESGIIPANKKIVLIGTEDRIKELNEIRESFIRKGKDIQDKYKEMIHIGNFKLLEVMELIKKSSLVITPDTAIVHIATAFDKPMIGIYRKDLNSNDNNTNEWGPNSKFAKVIYAEASKELAEKSDINSFEMKEFKRVLKKI